MHNPKIYDQIFDKNIFDKKKTNRKCDRIVKGIKSAENTNKKQFGKGNQLAAKWKTERMKYQKITVDR